MLLELAQYKRPSKKEVRSYVWRIEEKLYEKIKEVAAENKAYPSVVMRYIIDWACDKMNDDEKFRDYILEITLKENKNEKKKKKAIYTLSKELNDKLVETDEKYRIYNINHFVVASVRKFFEENGK